MGFETLTRPGDVILMVSLNHIYMLIFYLAAAGSERTFTAANPSYTIGELVHQMKSVGSALVLVHPSVPYGVLDAASQVGVEENRVLQSSGEKFPTSTQGTRSWQSFWTTEQDAKCWKWNAPAGKKARETVCVINFSSETTGLPEGVCITHYNFVANTAQVMQQGMTNRRRKIDS